MQFNYEQGKKYFEDFAKRLIDADKEPASVYSRQWCRELIETPDISSEEKKELVARFIPAIMGICSYRGRKCATCDVDPRK
jgi:hypothetical protein